VYEAFVQSVEGHLLPRLLHHLREAETFYSRKSNHDESGN